MPSEAAGFKAGEGSRTPAEILAHIGDLLDWALSLAKGAQAWHNSQPLEWDQEVNRFFATWGRSRYCGGWPALQSRVKTTPSLKLQLEM
jgi:hypothetical protein